MTSSDFPTSFLDALDAAVMARDGRTERNETRFRCPSPDHEDNHPSARWNREKAAWTCDACGEGGGAFALAFLLGVERPRRPRRSGSSTPNTLEHSNTPSGLTLADYAAAKGLPVDFLLRLGLADFKHRRGPSVRIPLYNQRPAWLAHAHAALDRAVWAAYGWDDPDPVALAEETILARLLALNLERSPVR